MEINNNKNNSSLISSLDKKGVVDLTKDFIRNTLYEKLKNNKIINEAKLNPSNYNIDDKNLLTMMKLEYTLIEDFLIRTKLFYTHSIFNKEIKSLIKPLIPFDDGELMSLLGINLNKLASLRFNGNNSNDISSQIKSTYLYQILNLHTKIIKIDNESQTYDLPINEKALYNPDVRVDVPNSSDIQIKLKNIEDKYNRKLKEETDILLVENRFNKYKKEVDKRYEEELKNEIERFKTYELSKMRKEENEKYEEKLKKLENDYEDEYKKKYEEFQKSMKERESNLENNYEERYNQLKTQYEGKVRNLEYKEKYLDNKYKNDMDASVHIVKFNEELNSLRDLNNDKENKIKKNDNSISILNTEIGLIKKDISDINNLLNNQHYLRNNYIKQEEEKKINYNINNNIKPSKESVLNSLNILARSNNNINKSGQSQSGSGVYKSQNKKERRKIVEELEEEQYKLNNQIREEFQKILDTDFPLLIEKDEYSNLKKTNNNNADYLLNQYKEKYLYNDNNNVNKNNNIYNDYNKNKDINEYNNTNNIDNKYDNKYDSKYDNKYENKYNNKFDSKYDSKYDNKYENISSNNNYYNNLDKNKDEKNDEAFNSSNNNSKKRQNNSINKSNNKSINNTSPNNNNNIGGFNIGGFNLGNYNFGIKNNNNNNNYNYTIKSNTSESIIEENLEGETNNNQKKENSIKKNNNFINSNRYEKKGKNPPIKEENEENFQDSDVSNNSKKNNKYEDNKNNNLNVNKSNKFNNYDYNDIIKNDEDEIDEDINYGNENDISGKKKMDISASISGIAKKQAEVSESAGGFGGLLQLQSHAGGFGYNDKESYGDFEFSKGKNNNINNKKGNDKGFQNKFQNYQNNGTSEDIEEDISQS